MINLLPGTPTPDVPAEAIYALIKLISDPEAHRKRMEELVAARNAAEKASEAARKAHDEGEKQLQEATATLKRERQAVEKMKAEMEAEQRKREEEFKNREATVRNWEITIAAKEKQLSDDIAAVARRVAEINRIAGG